MRSLPPFTEMFRNFLSVPVVSREELFQTIGWGDLVGNSAYADTCAVRMSYALIRCGYRLPGRMPVKSGSFRGALIEPGQAKLSVMLAGSYAKPEKFQNGASAKSGVGKRRGIISFFGVYGARTDGGHIDLVDGGDLASNRGGCGSQCYWGAYETWFWPLK